MTTMGTHSRPIDGTVTANGRALTPFAIGDSLTGRPRGPVSALPQQDSPGQPRTAADKPGRRRWWRREGATFIGIALFAVAQVAVVAFSGSWQHQYELSIHLGQAHWVAGMQPLSVEGLIVSASLVIWYAARHQYRKRDAWGAYLVLAAGVGQTVLMNLGADYRWPWLRPEISVWPAVAFVAAYEMAVWLVRKRQDGGGDGETDCPRCGHRGHPRTPMECGHCPEGYCESRRRVDEQPDSPQDKPVDKTAGRPAGKVDKPARRGTAPDSRTALDKAAAAIRDNPHLADSKAWTELAGIAGVSTKTVQRARNGKTGSPA